MTASPVIAPYHIEVYVLYDLIYLQTQESATIRSMDVSGWVVLHPFAKDTCVVWGSEMAQRRKPHKTTYAVTWHSGTALQTWHLHCCGDE